MINNNILVSICCVAYNHESFIKNCLDGFVNQKTNFNYEILIHDDASTDNTQSIIRSYEERYPDKVRGIYQTENQWVKNNCNPLIEILFPIVRGKYIALCEGDDYWTDPYKLQKQVDFLENDNNYVLCFTRGYILNEFTKTKRVSTEDNIPTAISFDDLLAGNNQLTATCVFRNILSQNIPNWFKESPFGDFALYLTLLYKSNKKAICLNDLTACYRIHSGGIHGRLHASNKKLINAHKMHIQFYNIIEQNLIKNKRNKKLNSAINERLNTITKLLLEEHQYFNAYVNNFAHLRYRLGIKYFLFNLVYISKGLIRGI